MAAEFNKNTDIVLLFNPDSGVGPHYAAQCILGRTLRESGYRVLSARCPGLYFRCPVMDMHGLPFNMTQEQKQQVCMSCMVGGNTMSADYGIESFNLGDFATPEIAEKLKWILHNLPPNLLDFELEGVQFGKLCAMDLILCKKDSQLGVDISPELHHAWVSYIASSVLSYLMVDRVCQTLPVKRMFHFNEYCILNAARLAAQKNGVAVSSITLAPHMNNDRRLYVIVPDSLRLTCLNRANFWGEWRKLALAESQVHSIASDSLLRLGGTGTHVFSPPKSNVASDLRQQMGVPPNKKLLVVYTSSLDETFANRYALAGMGLRRDVPPQPFSDQIEWLKALCQFVAHRDDLYVIVRVHPREGISRRSRVTSAHLQQLQAEFNEIPANCRIVWPDENISSYDLGEQADLVLTSWSTIGIEMARLGVPVLSSTQGYEAFPHDDFIEWGATPELYFKKLELLLRRPHSLTRIKHAYRWYHTYSVAISLDLGDLIPRFDYDGLPPFKMPDEAAAIESAIIHGKPPYQLNLERQIAQQNPHSLSQEDQALRRELRRIVHCLCSGSDSEIDQRLIAVVCSDGLLTEAPARLLEMGLVRNFAILFCGPDRKVSYVANNASFFKSSPMCQRLAELCADEILTVTSTEELIAKIAVQ